MAWWPVTRGAGQEGSSLNFFLHTSNLSSLKRSRWGMSTMSELCREAGLKFHALSQGVTWLTLGHNAHNIDMGKRRRSGTVQVTKATDRVRACQADATLL